MLVYSTTYSQRVGSRKELCLTPKFCMLNAQLKVDLCLGGEPKKWIFIIFLIQNLKAKVELRNIEFFLGFNIEQSVVLAVRIRLILYFQMLLLKISLTNSLQSISPSPSMSASLTSSSISLSVMSSPIKSIIFLISSLVIVPPPSSSQSSKALMSSDSVNSPFALNSSNHSFNCSVVGMWFVSCKSS